MKLYEDRVAPNPRRVRIFLAEKKIDVPRVNVEIMKKENRTEEFYKKNPSGLLPVLELDDGSCISESIAICRYFEELHPEPALFGKGAKEKALVEMWQRKMELEVFLPLAQVFRNTHVFWKGRIPQVPEYGEVCREAATKRLAQLDRELEGKPFIAGEHYSVADITALVGIDFARISNIRIQDDQKNLKRWHESVSARPSAKA